MMGGPDCGMHSNASIAAGRLDGTLFAVSTFISQLQPLAPSLPVLKLELPQFDILKHTNIHSQLIASFSSID
jgi:hypothetical protein